MGKIREINIKNLTYCFSNDQINFKDFHAKLLKIGNCNNIDSVNPLYLMINEMIGHFECNSVEEKNENKYLVLDDVDENKEVFKKI